MGSASGKLLDPGGGTAFTLSGVCTIHLWMAIWHKECNDEIPLFCGTFVQHIFTGPVGFLIANGNHIRVTSTRSSKGINAVFERAPDLIG
jgi:hypothetical protein